MTVVAIVETEVMMTVMMIMVMIMVMVMMMMVMVMMVMMMTVLNARHHMQSTQMSPRHPGRISATVNHELHHLH